MEMELPRPGRRSRVTGRAARSCVGDAFLIRAAETGPDRSPISTRNGAAERPVDDAIDKTMRIPIYRTNGLYGDENIKTRAIRASQKRTRPPGVVDYRYLGEDNCRSWAETE